MVFHKNPKNYHLTLQAVLRFSLVQDHYSSVALLLCHLALVQLFLSLVLQSFLLSFLQLFLSLAFGQGLR